MLVKDKGWHNYSNYIEEGWGLTFDDFTDGEASYVTDWRLSNGIETLQGNDIPELINALELLIARKEVKVYSDNKKDILIIYTNKLLELFYYLIKRVTTVFPEDVI